MVDAANVLSGARARLLSIDGSDSRLTAALIERLAPVWRSEDRIVVTGVAEPEAHVRALTIAAACGGSVRIERTGPDVVAVITPVREIPEPSRIPEPVRPADVPAAMEIVAPRAIGNDYRELVRGVRAGPMPMAPVSVLVRHAHDRRALELTLRALTHQTYPGHLMEILVVHSGETDSESIVQDYGREFGRLLMVQSAGGGDVLRDRGFGAASHDLLVSLDSTMVPTPGLVESYVRHLMAFPGALYCGRERSVDASALHPDDLRDSISPLLSLPDDASAVSDDTHSPGRRVGGGRLDAVADDLRFDGSPFRAVEHANVAVTKDLLAIVGPFASETVDRRTGLEFGDWSLRVWNRGFHIVPVPDAVVLRSGRQERSEPTGVVAPRLPASVDEALRDRWDDVTALPLVSVYVPAHDAESTIVDTVRSALGQTVRSLEVCVVDDGSTDRTAALLDEHFGDDPRVRIVHQANQGIGAASNRAVRMCRGVFIGQLDSDDLLLPDAVEKLLGPLLQDTRIGVSYGSPVKIDDRGEVIGPAWTHPEYSRSKLLRVMIVHHFRLFRARDWYRTTGFATDIRNAVDYDMFLKLSEITEMRHVDEPVYLYRVHDSGTSVRHRDEQYRNHALVVRRALERRGLDADWTIEQTDPDDPRQYRFVSRSEFVRDLGEFPNSPGSAGAPIPPTDHAIVPTPRREMKATSRIVTALSGVAAWYRSVVGVTTALALALVAVLALVGAHGASTVVLVLWLALVIPYKLQRERLERLAEATVVSDRLDRVGRTSRGARDAAERAHARIVVAEAARAREAE